MGGRSLEAVKSFLELIRIKISQMFHRNAHYRIKCRSVNRTPEMERLFPEGTDNEFRGARECFQESRYFLSVPFLMTLHGFVEELFHWFLVFLDRIIERK